MVLPPQIPRPTGETEISLKKCAMAALVADTFDGKIHIEWDRKGCRHFQSTIFGEMVMSHHFKAVERCSLASSLRI